MRTTVIIQNLSCDDCKQTLVTALENINGITNYKIDVSKNSLTFDYSSHNAMEGLRYYLSKIGYPITKDPRILKETKEEEQKLALRFKKELEKINQDK